MPLYKMRRLEAAADKGHITCEEPGWDGKRWNPWEGEESKEEGVW